MRVFRKTLAVAVAGALVVTPAAAQSEPPLPVSPVPASTESFVPRACPSRHLPRHNSNRAAPTARPITPVRQDYEPRPAMWRLSDADTSITIFGTFHILPEGFRWRTPLFDQVVAEVDEVVFESRDDEEANAGEAAESAEELRFLELKMRYRPSQPLSERISERNRPKLKRMLQLAGIEAAMVDYAPPLITMFAIADATAEAEGSLRDFGVETVIEAEFKASGRPVSAIEDPIQVLENLLALDESKVIAMLDEGFDEWDGCALVEPGRTDWETEHGWAQGKLGDASIQEMMEDPFFKAFYQVLLVDRNRAWTEWLAKRMEQPGKLLLAVGAGHMEGPDSVILMLEQRGLKVERIQ
jgi:uncharacterized protein YbaP (TraB family)